MHATVGQLLSFRDGVALDAALERHIVECARCRRALDDLVAVRSGLRDLRDLTPPDRAWEAIKRRMPREAPTQSVAAQRSPWAIGIAACLAAVVGVVLTAGRDGGGLPPAPSESALELSQDARPAREELLARSREMEAFLRGLPARPRVVRVGTAATIADLEEGIRLVDYRLNLQAESGLTQSQSQRLWQARVDLLNSLANVRYVEAQRQIY